MKGKGENPELDPNLEILLSQHHDIIQDTFKENGSPIWYVRDLFALAVTDLSSILFTFNREDVDARTYLLEVEGLAVDLEDNTVRIRGMYHVSKEEVTLEFTLVPPV